MNVVHRVTKTALGVIVLIAIVGCLNPFESGSDRRDREGRFESGRLMGRMTINSGEGLTASTIGLGPEYDLRSQITRYAVVLTGLGELEGEAVTVDPYEEGTSIELAYGSWQLDMTAYRDENLVATGQVRPVGGHGPGNAITVGLDTATAEVELQPLTNTTGTLELTVTWDGTVDTVEQFTLSPIEDVDSWELGATEAIGPDEYALAAQSLTLSRTMDSGYYELILQVNQGSLQGHVVEVVQIYDHLVSTGTYNLTEFFPVTATVTFDAQGGDPPDPESKLVAPGSVYGTLPTPSREGYTLVGWSLDAGGEPIVTASSTVEESGDHTLFAQWEINEYTITFDSAGGTAVNPITQDFGTAITPPANPTREGFTFEGWDPTVPDTMPAENVTLLAQWEIDYSSMISVTSGIFTQQDTANNSFIHTISKDFKIGKYQVTYELWYTVRVWAEDNGYAFANPGCEGNDGADGTEPTTRKHEPVTMVSWHDAVVWLNAYSEKTGLTPVYHYDGTTIRDSELEIINPDVNWDADGYRLPTEGEWQFAASWRGNDGTDVGVIEYPEDSGSFWTPFNWASGATADVLNGLATDAVAWYDAVTSKTQIVGTKAANQLGIHDMSGNVREWVWDWYTNYPGEPTTDYQGPGTGTHRIQRGGSWNQPYVYLQVGERTRRDNPSGRHNFVGFRPARTVP